MRIIYIGSGRFGLACLNALRNSKHDIEFILTQPSRAAGRGRRTTRTAVAEWAVSSQIPFLETEDASEPFVIEKVRDINPDLIVVIAFGQKICDELINLPPKGMINVHGSLLPKYRGAAPINWAVVKGETETGVTIATVTSRWDAGRILGQTKTPINPEENAEQLSDRLSVLAAGLLLETLSKIESGTAVYTEQDDTKATLAPKLKKSDGYIDFGLPAATVRNMIRGFWPWPGASATFVSKTTGKTCRIIFVEAGPVRDAKSPNLPPGTLDEGLNIICGGGALKVARIKPAGGVVMTFEDFVNGYRVAPLDKFIRVEE